jgi:hypothetical protein
MTSVTVVVPMTIRRRGGRKQIIGPDGAPVQADGHTAEVASTRGEPALVKALARGFRWRRMLEEGRYASIRELAAAERVDRAYVGRVLNMTLLPPDLVEAILDGRLLRDLDMAALLDSQSAHWNQQPTTRGPDHSPASR